MYRISAHPAYNLKILADAGVPYGLGTHSGPRGRFPGYFADWEMELMVESGLTRCNDYGRHRKCRIVPACQRPGHS